MKKILAILLMVTMVGSFVGCTDKNNDATTATGWEYIREKGELIVGLDDTFAPMGFRNEQGELVGFDIDLGNAVGEVLDIKIKFQPISWDAKDMELSGKKIDCIWNGMSATPVRQEKMALTKKYLNNKIVIMQNEGVNITDKADLANLKIGTQAKSAALETMQADPDFDSFSGNISEYPTYDEVILDMQAGRIDCMVVDQVLGEYKNSKLEKKYAISSIDFGNDFYAIGCRKGETDVADKLNEALKTLIDNGEAEAISTKWFGKNIVILEDYE